MIRVIRVAIDLTWIRHGIVGGTEAYATNLVHGFSDIKAEGICFFLLAASDNSYLFTPFVDNKHIFLLETEALSASRRKRVWWQNRYMGKVLKENGISICIEPVYLKPFLAPRNIHFITTVHDLQAFHYPEYFNFARRVWMRCGWYNAIHTSDKIIVTSEFVRQDILSRYHIASERLCINYDPVTVDKNDVAATEKLSDYGVASGEYYYLVSSLLPHKNIPTIIRTLGLLKERKSNAFFPLLVSGVGGKSREELMHIAQEMGVAEDVILTPFISVSERNLLYRNCRAYLFPSLFEGFGMTPIEAMLFGAPVLATKESCTYETTGGLAEYVDDARDPEQWYNALERGIKAPSPKEVEALVASYTKEAVASRYLSLIQEINKASDGGKKYGSNL